MSKTTGKSCLFDGTPTEVVDAIIQFLPLKDQLKAARVNHRLQWIICRQIYQHITVADHQAVLLFITLNTRSPSSQIYREYVRSLAITVSASRDIYILFPLFGQAISRLVHLHKLSLYTPHEASEFVMMILKKYSVICKPKSFFATMPALLRGKVVPDSPGLPSLRHLVVDGDTKLIEIARSRNLKVIEILRPLGIHDLAIVEQTFRPPFSSPTLPSILHLNLKISDHLENLYAFLGIGSTFPALRELTLNIKSVNVLGIMDLLAQDPVLFPELTRMFINGRSTRNVVFDIVKSESVQLLQQYLRRASNMRPNLSTIQLGHVRCDARMHSYEWQIDTDCFTDRLQSSPHKHLAINNLQDRGLTFFTKTPPLAIYEHRHLI